MFYLKCRVNQVLAPATFQTFSLFSNILFQVLFYSKSEIGSISLFKICIIALSSLSEFPFKNPSTYYYEHYRHPAIFCILRAIIWVIKILSDLWTQHDYQPIRSQFEGNWPMRELYCLGAKQNVQLFLMAMETIGGLQRESGFLGKQDKLFSAPMIV